MTDLTSAVAWLINVDGLHSQGYCPTPSSALNIGLDIDFSQQNSDAHFKSHYAPDCLLGRLRPFYGALCSDSCYNPNSGSVKLSLTTEEVTVLSTGFTVTNVQAVASYGYHMSQAGRDVMASLDHWAGHLCYTDPCPSTFSETNQKLCIPYDGKMQNLLCIALKQGIANDIQLKLSLILTESAYKSLAFDAGAARMEKEIQHLSGNM